MSQLGHSANPDVEFFDPTTLRRDTTLFIRAKIFAQVLGISVYLIAAPTHWRASAMFVGIVACDLLLLIPYAFYARRNVRAAIRATYWSMALTTFSITVGLFLATGFMHWGVLGYFFVFPLGAIAVPRPQTAWVMAWFATVAYLLLIAAQLSGLSTFATPSILSEPAQFVFPLIVVLGFSITAFFIAQMLTVAQNERLLQKQLIDQAQARADAEAIWHMVGQTITSTQDLDQTLIQVLRLIHQKIHVEAGVVLLYDAQTGELDFAKAIEHDTERNAPLRIAREYGIAGWVITHRQSQIIDDITTDPRWNPQIGESFAFTARAALAVPLITHEQTIGVIELLSATPHAFTPDHLRMLEWIAAPVAIAIQNAQLNRQVREQLDGLGDLLDKVTHAKNEWEQTVDAIDAGIFMVDRDCRILRVNRTLANWLATTPHELIGQFCYQAIHHADHPIECCPHHPSNARTPRIDFEFDSPLMRRTVRLNAYTLRKPDGTIIGSVNVMQDVTAQNALQAQLIQSEKLAAIGRMAASLAHEINNPLQAIQGCLDLAQANPANLAKQQRYLTMAKGEVDRLATMVQRMLDFYRPAKGTRAPTDARTLLDEVLTLSMKRLQHARTSVHSEWASPLPPVIGNANQLKQVFLNLILNAADAMPNGGELKIRGRLEEHAGKWIVIDFIDSGVGIAPENIDKIFEPFYTTKTQGTGLGLGISHSIIVSHGGRLTAQSAVGMGSTFTVWLPAAQAHM